MQKFTSRAFLFMDKMQLGISLETHIFLLSVLLGAALGAVYDLLRVFREAVPHNKILLFIEDMIYTLLFAFSLFTFCTGLTGSIRGFTLIGMLLGCLLERFTAGNAVVFIAKKVCGLLRRFLGFLFSPAVKLITKIKGGFFNGFVKKCLNFRVKKKKREKPLKVEI